ncbi:sensor histidine kinase [Nocardioides bruguierae]|uniref:sensor histidine kinase n=1 Tax=Nocardioides bruguierae TaxID=2945102 RepID=UPI0020226654|nr:HAMP domain-containing sensor histidine kinase [Nocardioides bruguierae]MCL8023903.1 ATP-binding protein [Nocardioides bruguierae]
MPASSPHGAAPLPGDEMLDLVTEGVTRIAGFGVAAIGLVRGDVLQIVSVAGSDDARAELLGTRTPMHLAMAEIEGADEWGVLRFMPHDRLERETWGWVPDLVPLEGEDAWHPLDSLCAPLESADGELLGLLFIDVPVDGRRPGPEQRRVLSEYTAQASHAAVLALERAELMQQVRLATAAREIVRQIPANRGLQETVDQCCAALADGFSASGVTMQVFDDDLGSSIVLGDASTGIEPELRELGERAAREAWAAQTTLAIQVHVPDPDMPMLRVVGPDQVERVPRDDPARRRMRGAPPDEPPELAVVREHLARFGVGSALLVPIGAGPTCLGSFVLLREPGDPEWTTAETSAALDIGHDLGRVVLNARTFARGEKMLEDLRAVDRYKGTLIATVSHELKNPLSAVTGHLELLEDEDDLPGPVRTSLTAMGRASRRLTRVVDDLLLLGRVGDPDYPVASRPVDLRALVADVLEITAVEAARAGIEVTDVPTQGPVVADGDPEELERVVANLVSNAVKYSTDGGRVGIRLGRRGDVCTLEVTDTGLGISDEDKTRLFTEFFRSTNPTALARPGTGLGLSIVARIVERHRGSIEVESTLGVGSTFRVRLPGTPDPSVPV